MPSSPVAGDPGADDAPGMTRLAAPEVHDGAARRRPEGEEVELEIRPVEEIEAAIRRSNDKERAIGLVAAPVAAIVGLIISSASVNYAKTHHQSIVRLRQAHLRPPRPGRPDSGHVAGCASACSRASPWRSTAWPSSSCTTPTRVRRPVPAGRRLVPGAGLPAAAGAQAGGGGWSAAPRPKASPVGRSASPPQQALHAALLTPPRASGEVSLCRRRCRLASAWRRCAPRLRGVAPVRRQSSSATSTSRTPPGRPAGRRRPPTSARWRRWRPARPARDRPARRRRARSTRAGGMSRRGAARVGLAVEGVGAVARVPRRVAPAAAEKPQAPRHREGDRHAVVVQAVVLLVRVDPDDGEDDDEDGERDEHDPERHLTDAPAVDRHAGAAELPDTTPGPGPRAAAGDRLVAARARPVSRHGRVGRGHAIGRS